VKDFDQARAERATRDHTFKINDIVFRFRERVPRKIHARMMDLLLGSYRDDFPIGDELRPDGSPVTVYRTPTEEETQEIMAELVYHFLDPESHDAWRLLLRDEQSPLSSEELGEIVGYMIQVQSGRPLAPSSPSGDGAQSRNSGTPSTGVSASQAATSNE
jgi:hypothetical protein